MNILYLTGDYLWSKVHNNLIKNLLLKEESLQVYVFSPLRTENLHWLEGSYYTSPRLHVLTPQVDIPVPLYKMDFWAKQRCKVRLIERNIPIKDIDIIVAATFFSEGDTAYRLHKKYGIPYIVSIRGADVMTYSKRFIHLWPLAIGILNHAKEVVCITPSIKRKMQSFWQYRLCSKNIENARIIYNGIDSIWVDNLSNQPRYIGNPVKIIYIGRFDNNKNVLRLVKAVKLLKHNYNVSLTLIGGKGEEHENVLKQVEENRSYMEYLGPIYDKEQLMNIVRMCDIFAMVSHSETFGLVYAECLSQGLPIVYTLGTGFSDIYPQGYIGYGVNSKSIENIADGIRKVIDEYPAFTKNVSSLDFQEFIWDNIADKYLSLINNEQSNGTDN